MICQFCIRRTKQPGFSFRALIIAILNTAFQLVGCAESGSQLLDDKSSNLPSMTITASIKDFIYNRSENLFDPDKRSFEAEYKDVKLEFQGRVYIAKMKLRGGIRFCDSFPHFTIKLKGNDQILGGTKYKIVTHGSYDLDPAVSVNAPNCGDDLAEKPVGSDYSGEHYLYDLQSKISDFYLKTYPLTITYKDDSSSLEMAGFAFLIEDFEATAERYGAEETDFGMINEQVSWKEINEQEIRNTVLGDEYFSFLVGKYRELEEANPGYNKKQISELLPKPADIANDPDIMAKLNAATDARLPSIKSSLKTNQISILHLADRTALMQAAMFNVLVGNSDWAFFGLTTHPAGHRNLKFLDQGGKIIPLAYDFDLSNTASGNSVSTNHYKDMLASLKAGIYSTYGDVQAVPLQDVIEDYRRKVETMLNEDSSLKAHMRTSFENFLEATKQ
jgi:hypothetical protein